MKQCTKNLDKGLSVGASQSPTLELGRGNWSTSRSMETQRTNVAMRSRLFSTLRALQHENPLVSCGSWTAV